MHAIHKKSKTTEPVITSGRSCAPALLTVAILVIAGCGERSSNSEASVFTAGNPQVIEPNPSEGVIGLFPNPNFGDATNSGNTSDGSTDNSTDVDVDSGDITSGGALGNGADGGTDSDGTDAGVTDGGSDQNAGDSQSGDSQSGSTPTGQGDDSSGAEIDNTDDNTTDSTEVENGDGTGLTDGSGSNDDVADDTPVTLEPSLPCLLYTSPSPRDATLSRMPSSA